LSPHAGVSQRLFTLQSKKAGSPSASSRRSEGQEQALGELAHFLMKSSCCARSFNLSLPEKEKSGRFPALPGLSAAFWPALRYFELNLTSLSIMCYLSP